VVILAAAWILDPGRLCWGWLSARAGRGGIRAD
jgi:hypothetical protein